MTKPLKDLLHGVFKQESWKVKLLSEWDIVAGNLADKMRLEKIEGQMLIIGVYQASWMHELYLLSHVLKKSINDHLGHPHVQFLRFKSVTKKEAPKLKVPEQEKKVVAKKPPITLSGHEQQALTKIKDPELKEALHSFLSRCHYQKVT